MRPTRFAWPSATATDRSRRSCRARRASTASSWSVAACRSRATIRRACAAPASPTARTGRGSRATTRSTCSASRTGTRPTTRRARSSAAPRSCARRAVRAHRSHDLLRPAVSRALPRAGRLRARLRTVGVHLDDRQRALAPALRARAVENQTWVLAAAQGGVHENGRRTYGHSMLVDPWGEVAAERSEDGPGFVAGLCDPARTEEVRGEAAGARASRALIRPPVGRASARRLSAAGPVRRPEGRPTRAGARRPAGGSARCAQPFLRHQRRRAARARP